MDSTVHGILQDRMQECVAVSFSRGSSLPRDRTQISCIAGHFFTVWDAREVQEVGLYFSVPPCDLEMYMIFIQFF